MKHRENKETSSCVRSYLSQSLPSVSVTLPGGLSASNGRNCLAATTVNLNFSFEMIFEMMQDVSY